MTKCHETNLSDEQIEDRIDRYVSDEMSEAEREEFDYHRYSCEYCYDKVVNHHRIIRMAKIKFTCEDLCTAYDAKEWEKVIELGERMKALGSHEEVFPIDEKVKGAVERLKYSNEITLSFQGKIEILKDNIKKSLVGYGKLIIRKGREIIIEHVIDSDDHAYGFPDSHSDNIEFENEDVIIKVVRGLDETVVLINKK